MIEEEVSKLKVRNLNIHNTVRKKRKSTQFSTLRIKFFSPFHCTVFSDHAVNVFCIQPFFTIFFFSICIFACHYQQFFMS